MTTLELETGGDLLRRIDALLNTLADEYKVRLNAQEGLSVTAVDPANVGMLSFEVPPSGFETFALDYDAAVVGLPRKRLSSIAKYARKGGNSKDNPGDPVRLLWDEDARRYYVHVERDDVERFSSFAELDPDSIREEPDIPALDLPWESSVDSLVLRDVTRTLGESGYEHLQVAAEDLSNGVSGDPTAAVRLYSKADDGLGEKEDVFRPDATATWVGDGDPEAVASLYSLDYLRDMAKGLHAAKPDSVKVEFDRGAEVREVPPADPYGPGWTVVETDPLVVDDGERTLPARETDEEGVLRVAYDGERLDATEWALPSFSYDTPVSCPECGGLAWASFYSEEVEWGRPTNTGSVGAEAPRYRTKTVRFGEFRCNECGTHDRQGADEFDRGA